MNRSPLDTLRVIYFAAAAGMVLATGVLYAVRPPPGDPALGPVMGYLAAGLLLLDVAATQVIRTRLPGIMREDEAGASAALRAGQPARGTYVLLLLPVPLLEAPALLAALGLFFHGPTWLLAIPAACVATLLWAMPSRGALLRMLND